LIIGIGIAVILIELFFMLRIRTILEYSDNGFAFTVKLPFFKIVLPKKDIGNADKKSDSAKKPKKPKGGDIPDFKSIAGLALKTAGKLIRRVRIDELDADILIAGSDPFTVAMMYGGAAASFGVIFPVIENNFNIIKKNIRVNADFNGGSPRVYFMSKQSIALWRLLAIILTFAYRFHKLQRIKLKKITAERKEG
jgi:hypothetical protein